MEIKSLINEINRLFESNCYTDNKRITVDYCENADMILVMVMGETEVIDCEGYTFEGIMFKTLNVVQRLWGVAFDQ